MVAPVISRVKEDHLTVTISNLHNDKGHVLVSLFKGSDGFPGDAAKAFRKAKLTISNKTTSVSFPGLPSGTYAVAILHDENDDQEMNTNMLGIPREGYGFSNNETGLLGPPSFSKASFNYHSSETRSISIRTRY
jgi:uncharacterized protein (DUF2141 family)